MRTLARARSFLSRFENVRIRYYYIALPRRERKVRNERREIISSNRDDRASLTFFYAAKAESVRTFPAVDGAIIGNIENFPSSHGAAAAA